MSREIVETYTNVKSKETPSMTFCGGLEHDTILF